MSREEELAAMEEAAVEAGRCILEIAQKGFEVEDKNARRAGAAEVDPVTTADRGANDIIQRRLREEFPDYGWLSEETIDDGSRRNHSRVWVVDPLDGTREFVKGRPDYTVSIGLVEDGEPVAGVVYNPSTDMLYSTAGQGVQVSGQSFDSRSDVDMRNDAAQPLELLASRSEVNRGQFAPLESLARWKVVGSIAYKLARIAAGDADACLSFSPKSEWDLAAGVALIRANGGDVYDLQGERLRFNNDPPTFAGLIATTAAAEEQAKKLAALGERVP